MSTVSAEERLKELTPLFEKYGQKERTITEHNVHQLANKEIRSAITQMMNSLLLDGSQIYPAAHLAAFLAEIQAGKKGILFVEHYSNLDLPILMRLMEKAGDAAAELASRIVAIAGMKLTEEDPRIAAFAQAYERIVIYPSRSLASITDAEQLKEEEKRSRTINMASMKALDQVRKEGKVVLVFPAGTRYRPGKPETKRGVREIDSYVKTSDVMLLISINGNCLRISDDPSNMLGDIVCRDKVVMEVSPVIDCASFREQARDRCSDSEDKKQAVADAIMNELEVMHTRND